MKKRNEKNASGMEPIPPGLVAQAQAGDQAAFTELYERTSAMVYRTIRSMIRDEDLVWDIQQDSYIRAWQKLSELQTPEAFLPWLRRIAVNTAATALTRRVPLTFTDLEELEDEEEGWGAALPDLREESQPELILDRKETSRLVREILNVLPQEQQAIVGMYYSEEMTVKEIAELLHVTPGTVKTQLYRGRKRIEVEVRALEKQGVKLYGLSPIPFLLSLLRRLEPAARQEKKVLAAVLEQAPKAVGAASGGTAATVTALTAGQAFLKGLGVKLLAVAAVAALLVGGKLAYDALKKIEAPSIGDEQPTAAETAAPILSESPDQESTEPVIWSGLSEGGSCGDTLSWSFDPFTGTLTLEGSGDMYDYEELEKKPWYSCADSIRSVVLPEGLTCIGAYAFSNCTRLSSVALPEGVTSIGEYAFGGCSNLADVALPSSLTSISPYAFCNCYALESIDLPERLDFIGTDAFSFCKGLTSITIPEGVTSLSHRLFYGCSSLTSFAIHKDISDIGAYVFTDCPSLTAFSIDPENQSFSVDTEGVLYNKDKTLLVMYPYGKAGPYEVPAGVKSIRAYAFTYCKDLTAITLPESLTFIGASAFSGCSGLSSVTVPEGVTTLADSAFNYCPKLTDVKLPASLTSIGDKAFQYCSSLTSFTIPAGLAELGSSVFASCSNLTAFSVDPDNTAFATDAAGVLFDREKTRLIACPKNLSGAYVIPAGVTTIAEEAFDHCGALTSVTIPDSVLSIEPYAFYYCSSLREAVLPEGITSIEVSVFNNCTGLTSVTIPEGVTEIKLGAFSGCSGLTSIALPAGLTSIGEMAFESCCGLVSVVIPSGVTELGLGTFRGCSGLTSVELPEGLTFIGTSAFANCRSLISVTLPADLSGLGANAFNGCSSLTAITIPAGLTDLDDSIFAACSSLTAFIVDPANPEYASDESGVLYDKTKTTLLVCPCGKSGRFEIPVGVTDIEENAFENCAALTEVTIPDTVDSIGNRAFSGCTALRSAAISDHVTFLGEELFKDCSALKSVVLGAGASSVANSMFSGCAALESVVISEGVIDIRENAFYGCKSLSSVTIPDTVIYIESGAFSSCKSLTSLTIPESVTTIEDEAFSGCVALNSVTIPKSVTDIGENLFQNCLNVTIRGAAGSEAERYARQNGIPFDVLP